MLKQQIKILMIEDNPGDARLIREMLVDVPTVTFEMKIADRLTKGIEILGQNQIDVLLLDLSLPDSQGLETLRQVYAVAPTLPIVVLTGYDDETVGIMAVQEGAQDYLVKGQCDKNLLVRSLRYAIERKRAEAELVLERAKLKAILDNMGEGLIYHEGEQGQYINRALSQMSGYSENEFSGYLELLGSEQYSEQDLIGLRQEIETCVQRDGIYQGEIRLRHKDGNEFDAALTATPVVALDGSIMGIVTIIRDISQEKELQEQKSRFVANASHELRTPLTNLKTTLYLLQRQPEKLRDHMVTLDYIADRMRSLVDDLLDVTRFERGTIPIEPSLIVLQNPIEEVVNLQRAEAQRKSIQLTTELYPEPLTVNADAKRITQVITNLVINAINYTPQDGQVIVRLEPDSDGYAVITVQDSGIGIPADVLPRIFQPFFRVNEGTVKGTGLGLTITKEIVELHQGTIGVESDWGHGSAFIVRLALAEVPVM